MQKLSFVFGAACLLTGACLTFGGDDPTAPVKDSEEKRAPNDDNAKDETPKKPAKPVVQKSKDAPSDSAAETELSPDVQAIREEIEGFAQAYSQADAKKAAAFFTPEAEYVEPRGAAILGRDAIEASLKSFFEAHPGCQAEAAINSIRIVSPGVAIEDGVTKITHAENGEIVTTHYSAVHVKVDGKWLIASVRDHDPKRHRSVEDQLARLNWLLGDWVDEDEHSVVTFSCQPCDNGKFLLRQFKMKIDGQEALSGSQRIGWDTVTGQLRTWIFDSEGGHAEGVWHEDGESWTLKSTGVTSDGETASGTSVYTIVNEDTMTWQAIDHVIDGVAMPDSPVFTLVRKLPAPKPSLTTVQPKK